MIAKIPLFVNSMRISSPERKEKSKSEDLDFLAPATGIEPITNP